MLTKISLINIDLNKKAMPDVRTRANRIAAKLN